MFPSVSGYHLAFLWHCWCHLSCTPALYSSAHLFHSRSISSEASYSMHLLCHQSIHQPWHFETLLCGPCIYANNERANFWCVSNLIWVAYCILWHTSRLFYISLSLSLSESSLRNSITHIFSPVLFYCHTKKANRKWSKKKQQTANGRKELHHIHKHKKNGQNWCVCTIFIKKRNLNIHEEKNIIFDDEKNNKKQKVHVRRLCVHGTLALKTKTNTENNIQ